MSALLGSCADCMQNGAVHLRAVHLLHSGHFYRLAQPNGPQSQGELPPSLSVCLSVCLASMSYHLLVHEYLVDGYYTEVTSTVALIIICRISVIHVRDFGQIGICFGTENSASSFLVSQL